MRMVPEFLETGTKSLNMAAVSKKDGVKYQNVVVRAFHDQLDPQTLYNDLMAGFRRRCVQEKMDAYTEMSNTPLHQSMQFLDADSAKPDFTARVQAFAATLGQNRPSDARLELIQRLDKALLRTDQVMSVINGYANAVRRVGGAPVTVDIEGVRRQTWQYMNLQHVYLYREANDDELQKYVEMVEQPASVWFHQTYLAAMNDVVQSHMSAAVNQMVKEFQAHR